MADEWDDVESNGKSFGKGDYTADEHISSVQQTDDDSGWNDNSSPPDAAVDKRFNNFGSRDRGGRGRGGGGGRQGGGGRNGGDWGGERKENGWGDSENGDRRGGGGGDRWGGGGDRRGGGGDRRGGGGARRGGGGDRRGGGGRFGDRDRDGDEGGRFGGRDRDADDGGRSGGRDRDGNDRDGGGRGRGRGGGRGGGQGNDRSDQGNDDNFQNEKPREFYIPPEPTDNEDEIFKSGISSGINFDKYDRIPIKVSSGAPDAITSFEKSGLKEFLLENIRKSGYTQPTPIQKHAIPIVMKKLDLMACAQTGSGKTAAFLVPIINDLLCDNQNLSIGRPHVLIVSPTRELSIQIFNEARKFALSSYLKISIVYGGTAVKHQGANIAKGCHILVATPGRLLDFVDKGMITFEDTRFVVLDEADRMLDMGFMSSVEKIMKHPTIRPMEERQTLMFSATFPEDIQRLAGQFLNNYIFVAIGIVGGACADVEQNFYPVARFEKRNKLTQILGEAEPKGTMVFVETKRNADYLASLLSETQYPTTSIHGDRLQREREEALSDFKSGKMMILIATSVAARGLDIKNVAHVINYDLPKSIDEYVHRIGRTGRVGNRGKATSFFDREQDSALAADLVKILKQAEQSVPDFLSDASCGGGGGGGGGFGRNFGGRDVRSNAQNDNRQAAYSEPAAQEPEEEW